MDERRGRRGESDEVNNDTASRSAGINQLLPIVSQGKVGVLSFLANVEKCSRCSEAEAEVEREAEAEAEMPGE